MYEDHFGLTGRPFQLTPDARFWYETATHRKAMAYLGYGIAQGEGFIVVTGDIGAGKTTLVGHLTGLLDPAALNVITIVSTAIAADDLLRVVATGLGVDPANLTKAQLLTAIERGLHAVKRSGRRTLLIVDEVQALPVDSLEELRMLSNFQAGGHALLQILLLGQPEFRERLQGSERLEQLRQRVIAIHHLDPMEPHEVADYVAHRLSVVGWQGRPDFADDAFEALYRGSGGVPRRLNQLAARVMLAAALEGHELIDGRLVRQVVRDLEADLPASFTPSVAQPTAEPEPELVTQAAVTPEPLAVEPTIVPIEAEPEATTEEPAIEDVTPIRRFVPRTPQWLEPVADAPRDPLPIVAEPAAEPVEVPAFAPIVADASDEATQEPLVEETPIEDAPATAEAEAQAAPAAPASSDAERIAALEARIAQQEEALRRVLTLLVDWVEADRSEAAATAMVAGVADLHHGHDAVPIRSPAAWDHAA
ncbi:general secretion pathway protein GspA [Arthrobacter sp. TPD3018]|uniref:ExeA family protein n=1 Tax=Bacteria TaxID=2 RepID=UPI000D51C5CC|nr:MULTISPECIES: AAA family ATPase [Bacteria]PVE59591.1 general secretion pathway protein GspA [Sphingomonas sp. TPD3009]PVE61107.1 general secretion pathway protein GspA [Arthrobacter sp. TPD3018]PVE85974.1 general secretion pathway protein GspA [Sphingomonas melonis]